MDKKIAIVAHQKASSLQNAIFNNAYGISAGKLGSELLDESLEHLTNSYPHIQQIHGEKVLAISGDAGNFIVTTNKFSLQVKTVVIAIGAGNPFTIEGLEHFIEPHQKIPAIKNRIQLKNTDHLVSDGIFVAGVLAGHRSQLSIAAGSGAAVATDILTLWNDGNHTMVHDALGK
jgi:thioredoxin reductase